MDATERKIMGQQLELTGLHDNMSAGWTHYLYSHSHHCCHNV